jgi:hypothetical protein
MTLRERTGREASPSAGVLDSQSVKSAERGHYPTTEAGYEAGKQPKGAKSALWSTATGAGAGRRFTPPRSRPRLGRAGPRPIRKRVPRVELIWADGGYDAWQVEAAVGRRIGSTKRTSCQDFENFAETSASFVTLSSIPSGGLPGHRP